MILRRESMQSSQLTEGAQEWRQKLAFWVIPAITVLVLGIIIGTNLDNIRELFVDDSQSGVEADDDFAIGKELKATGLLERSDDFRINTHTLLTDDMGTLGLRSSSLNLSLYQGRVVVRGTIEEYHNEKYIVEVVAVEKSDIKDGLIDDEVVTGTLDNDIAYEPTHDAQRYFGQAGLLFDVEGEWDYHAKDEEGQIVLRSLLGDEEININYFECQEGDANYDCDALADRFADAAEYKLTSANGDLYYKLPEAEAWFVRNGSLYGYFINGADKEVIEGLTKAIVLPNRLFVEETVMPHATKLCSSIDASLIVVDKFDVASSQENLTVTIDGTDAEDQKVQCVLSVDMLEDLGASLVSMKVNGQEVSVEKIVEEEEEEEVEEEEEEEVEEEQENEKEEQEEEDEKQEEIIKREVIDNDYDQEQVAINVDNPYIFESSRGHRMVFPSRNITFAPGGGDAVVSLDGVTCYTYTNLTAYDDEETLESDPSVQIFECTLPEGFSDFGTYRHDPSNDGKNFLIRAIKPSWQQFADNIVIE